MFLFGTVARSERCTNAEWRTWTTVRSRCNLGSPLSTLTTTSFERTPLPRPSCRGPYTRCARAPTLACSPSLRIVSLPQFDLRGNARAPRAAAATHALAAACKRSVDVYPTSFHPPISRTADESSSRQRARKCSPCSARATNPEPHTASTHTRPPIARRMC